MYSCRVISRSGTYRSEVSSIYFHFRNIVHDWNKEQLWFWNKFISMYFCQKLKLTIISCVILVWPNFTRFYCENSEDNAVTQKLQSAEHAIFWSVEVSPVATMLLQKTKPSIKFYVFQTVLSTRIAWLFEKKIESLERNGKWVLPDFWH